MSEPQPFTDDELAQARSAPLGWTARRWLATVDALRAALAARPQPDALTAEQLRYGHEGERWVRCYTCREHSTGRALYHPTPWADDPEAARSATPEEQTWVDDALAMFDEGTAKKVAGSATPNESDCTCVPGEGCDAEGDPGCRYCQVADSELPCPADDDAVAGATTPTGDDDG